MPKPAPHTTVVVPVLPLCDFSASHGVAYADAKTNMGPWGYVCESCFKVYGCRLGLGFGQRLILEGSDEHRGSAA